MHSDIYLPKLMCIARIYLCIRVCVHTHTHTHTHTHIYIYIYMRVLLLLFFRANRFAVKRISMYRA